jgi:hypothetical protein
MRDTSHRVLHDPVSRGFHDKRQGSVFPQLQHFRNCLSLLPPVCQFALHTEAVIAARPHGEQPLTAAGQTNWLAVKQGIM